MKTVDSDFEQGENLQKIFEKSGFSGLSESEILQLLLSRKLPENGGNQIISELLRRFGSLKGVFMADYQELIQVKGVNRTVAIYILFLRELYHFSGKSEV